MSATLEAALRELSKASWPNFDQSREVKLHTAESILSAFAAALYVEEVETLKMQLDLTRADYQRDRVRMEQVVSAEHRANQAERKLAEYHDETQAARRDHTEAERKLAALRKKFETAETIAHRAEHRANQAESERDELRAKLSAMRTLGM